MAYIGNTNITQAFTPAIDYFSGTGSATAFTLSRPVASVAQVQVTIDNVAQNPSSAYTISGSTITFTSAPLSGTNNIYVYYTSPITQVIAPGQGTVTSASFGAITNFTTTGNTILGDASTDTLNVGNGDLVKDASGNVGIGTSSPTVRLNVSKDGGSGDAGQFVRITDTNTANSVGPTSLTIGMMNHYAGNPRMSIAGTTGLSFCVGDGSDFNSQRKVDIDSSGNLLVGTTTNVNGARLKLVWVTGGYGIESLASANTISYHANFGNASNPSAGNISTTNNATNYATASDYRLKEDILPMVNALGVVAQLKPVTYKWKNDGSDGQGFIAHELQEVVEGCVTGTKDATREQAYEVTPAVKDEEGNVITGAVIGTRTVPLYQGIDTSFLVATLTAAIQEQQALITSLTARITALESR